MFVFLRGAGGGNKHTYNCVLKNYQHFLRTLNSDVFMQGNFLIFKANLANLRIEIVCRKLCFLFFTSFQIALKFF